MSAQEPKEIAGYVKSGRTWSWFGSTCLQNSREVAKLAKKFLIENRLSVTDLNKWELMLSEATANCTKHRDDNLGQGEWGLELFVEENRVTATISDNNQAFEWLENQKLPEDDYSESGRGMYIIEQLSDSIDFKRSKSRNILTIQCNYIPVPEENLELMLNEMTEELSSCYESLAGIFRYTAVARKAKDLQDFATQLLSHLMAITQTECGFFRIVENGQLVTLASERCAFIKDCHVEESPLELEKAAIDTQQDQWIEVADRSTIDGKTICKAGVVHPFYHEDKLIGVLSIGRYSSKQAIDAGQLNMIHTFCEFLAQDVINRHHQKKAIQANIDRREFDLAATIQQQLLPSKLPEVPGLSVSGHAESAFSVGGDIYDITPCGEHGFFFMVADVMGKGVAASMLAAVTRSTIHALKDDYRDPAMLLTRAAELMHDDLDKLEMFVTLAVGMVDVTDQMIRVANAGHCPVVIVHEDGSSNEIQSEHPPVGFCKGLTFQGAEFPLKSGDRLLAYTDGFVDPRNSRPIFEDEGNVTSWFIKQAAGGEDVQRLKLNILERLGHNSETQNPQTLSDDQTFLLIGFG